MRSSIFIIIDGGILVLLRSADVVPDLILFAHGIATPVFAEKRPFNRCVNSFAMFGNSVIGLIGFVNLIMTVSWYEGVFMIVLIGYLIVRGLLSDMME